MFELKKTKQDERNTNKDHEKGRGTCLMEMTLITSISSLQVTEWSVIEKYGKLSYGIK